MAIPEQWPSFEDLPLDKNGPAGNAWGLFGPDDQLGMLNLLTPETIQAAAASEIRTGIRVSLDWELDQPLVPNFGRQKFEHQIVPSTHLVANDDVLVFNTQGSSQWDGFRHFAYQKSGQFFNGHSQADFEKSSTLGINVWVKNGGIVGRGILLDWKAWADRKGIHRNPHETGAVTLEDLHEIIKETGLTIKPGDILFIRVGFTAGYNELSVQAKEEFPNRKPIGVLGFEATRDSLRWLWENRFSAVASDCPSFERGPIMGPFNDPDMNVHQWALAGWGMPIGELFDLEELSVQCKKLGRYSFFVSSVPLKVPNGVASPPNAVAIF